MDQNTSIIKWHAKETSEIFKIFHSEEHGITQEEAAVRLKKYGLNKLPETKPDSFFMIFFRQFENPLIYILFAASIIVFAMGGIADGLIIIFVLLFNAVMGTIQEGKAQNTLLALKNFIATNATIIRNNEEIIIKDSEVVPGDVIILQAGNKIPADARIIFSNNLTVNESALTGESGPIHKTPEIIRKGNLQIADQKNMLFKGTNILAGNGKAIAVATGLETAIGKISRQIAAIDTEIPLKANIRNLSRLIITVVAVISAILFFAGLSLGKGAAEMFATVVSLSVSIIPEGLPIVMTLVLATGVWRMAKRNALVKKLQAVEALGQARIIAVDKTGTITKNEIEIQKVFVQNRIFEIGGVGYEPKGEIKLDGKAIDPLNHPELLLAGKIAAFSADAELMFSEEKKEWQISGDPTEAAMLVLSEKIGFHKGDLERESPKIFELPFDYNLKYHATIHKAGSGNLLLVAGAPEIIMELSDKIWRNNKSCALKEKEKEELGSAILKMSKEGLRVIAFSMDKKSAKISSPENVNNLTFVGFFGMKDSIRPEAVESVKKALSAGIKIKMITGDNRITAEAIAKEAGIFKEGDKILTGLEIDKMSDKELSERIVGVSVFARVTPSHKLRIINAYKQRGEIIAMTGDGVNDAPPLVAADLGVAMGKIGTEVAKEAADIILLDDNLESIISAIEEGRSIYKTIKKVILYLFSTSFGETLTIAGALFLGYPLPILPAQIIWLNFVTDGFLDVALAMESKEKNLLRDNFEHPKKYLIDFLMAKRMLLMAIPMMAGTLFLFKGYFESDITKAWTMALTTLAVFQWFNAWNCKSETQSIFRLNPLSNKYLVGATAVVIALQIFAVYNPLMQNILHTTPLALSEWLIILSMASSIIVIEEIRKFFSRKYSEKFKKGVIVPKIAPVI